MSTADPSFAVADRQWWESRTPSQLKHMTRDGDSFAVVREASGRATTLGVSSYAEIAA